MRKAVLIGILIGSICWGQESPLNVAPSAPAGATSNAQPRTAESRPLHVAPGQMQTPAGQQAAGQAGAAGGQQTQGGTALSGKIEVPEGTRIQLRLTNPITTRTMSAGTPIRARIVFPVAVGTQMVVPVGTYVEGAIDGVSGPRSGSPVLRAHFTTMIFANGYTVPIESTVAMKDAAPFGEAASGIRLASYEEGAAAGPRIELAAMPAPGAFPAQQQEPPPPPKPGPSGGEIAAFVAIPVVATVVVILLARKGGWSNGTVFASGYAFDMVLNAPVELDGASVAAAIAATQAQ